MNPIGSLPRPVTGARRAEPKADAAPTREPEQEQEQQPAPTTAEPSSAPQPPSNIKAKSGDVDITAELRMLQGANTSLQVSQVIMKMQQKLLSASSVAGFDENAQKTTGTIKRIRKGLNTAQKKFRNISKEELMQARQQAARHSEEAQKLKEELQSTRRKNRRKEEKDIRKIGTGEEQKQPFDTAFLPGSNAATSDLPLPIPTAADAAPAVGDEVVADAVAVDAAPPPSLNVVV